MKYKVGIKAYAEKQIRKLTPNVERRVRPAILALANNPRPRGVLKLKDYENRWRIRVGDYRIVYEIRDNILLVLVVAVPHRSQAYDRP